VFALLPRTIEVHHAYLSLALLLQEDVYAGKVTEGMRDVVLAVASNAKGHLDESRALASRLPKGASQVLLSSIGCARYLEALEAANFDPFHASLQSRPGVQGAPLMYVLAVKYHMLMGTY
jgi:NADH dehydrogenase [ubiquinone] 1 alpha subcomplex assembly factor 6